MLSSIYILSYIILAAQEELNLLTSSFGNCLGITERTKTNDTQRKGFAYAYAHMSTFLSYVSLKRGRVS
jgi:hypothetical protein